MKEMLAEEEKRPGQRLRSASSSRAHQRVRGLRRASARPRRWEDILAGSGLTRAQIREAAEIAMKAKRIICCWAMGLTQHKNAVATIQEVMNFLLLGGHIGRPGAGPCPVRGHSNVQGDRTMGIWERMNDQFMDEARRGVSLHAAAGAWHRYRGDDQGHARGQDPLLPRAWAATSSPPRPIRNSPRRRCRSAGSRRRSRRS